jgi:hypothetical protein
MAPSAVRAMLLVTMRYDFGRGTRSPTLHRGEQGMKRSLIVDGNGIPLDRVLATASRNDSPLLATTLDSSTGSPPDAREPLDPY